MFLSLMFTGDLAPIGSAQSLPDKPYKLQVSSFISEIFNKQDLIITNLETPLTQGNDKITKTGPHLKAHPESIKLLEDLKIDIVCLSNNHIRDYGSKGVLDTIKTCKDKSILTVGAGANSIEAAKPLIKSIAGRQIAICNFSETEYNVATNINAGSNPDEFIHIYNSIKRVKDEVDLVFVVMHGGKEMYPYPTPAQLKLYRFIIEIGAHAVIGHHSHVVGGYEIYKDAPIIYSLGNFIFDEAGNSPGWYYGSLVSLIIDDDNNIETNFFKIKQKEGAISLVEGHNSDNCNNSEVSLSEMRLVNKKIVEYEWEKLISDSSFSVIKTLLNLNLLTRILIKLKIFRMTGHDKRHLVKLGNRFRSRTHRNITRDVLNNYYKEI